MHRAHLDSSRCALCQRSSHQIKRRSVFLRFLDGGYDAPASRAYRKNRKRAEFAGAQLHFVGAQRLAGLNVDEHERSIILCSFKWQVQKMANRAVRTIATDDERGGELCPFTFVIEYGPYQPCRRFQGSEERWPAL